MKIIILPDIHGRYEALGAMLRHCGAVDEALRWAAPDFTLVQLGDLVDRGPRARECVQIMLNLQQSNPDRVVVLKGNHEDLLIRSHASFTGKAAWLVNGGGATLESYGGDFQTLCGPGGSHYEWMGSRPVSWECHGVLFVHGGLSAGNLKRLDPERLMWDRPPLTRGPYKALVCGHTPTASGHIEAEGGIFRCDIGLGYGREAALEYLELELGEEGLRNWKIRVAL